MEYIIWNTSDSYRLLCFLVSIVSFMSCQHIFKLFEGHSTVNYIIAIFLQTQAGTLLRIKYLIITFTSNKL